MNWYFLLAAVVMRFVTYDPDRYEHGLFSRQRSVMTLIELIGLYASFELIAHGL